MRAEPACDYQEPKHASIVRSRDSFRTCTWDLDWAIPLTLSMRVFLGFFPVGISCCSSMPRYHLHQLLLDSGESFRYSCAGRDRDDGDNARPRPWWPAEAASSLRSLVLCLGQARASRQGEVGATYWFSVPDQGPMGTQLQGAFASYKGEGEGNPKFQDWPGLLLLAPKTRIPERT